jgi:hypothetical protein
LQSPPWLSWPLWNICVTNNHRYVPLVVNTSRSFPHSRLITGFVTRLTRRVPLVEQELLTLPEHLSSPPVFTGVCVTRSLVLYVCFVDRCLSFCTFSFDHCVVCSSLIYRFWLPLWYLLVIVLSVLLWYTDSDYPFGIFWSLCCLFFFDIHILITSLWYLRYTDSDYPFGILDIQILITSLWYLQALLTL